MGEWTYEYAYLKSKPVGVGMSENYASKKIGFCSAQSLLTFSLYLLRAGG